jgi:hypothetical protein
MLGRIGKVRCPSRHCNVRKGDRRVAFRMALLCRECIRTAAARELLSQPWSPNDRRYQPHACICVTQSGECGRESAGNDVAVRAATVCSVAFLAGWHTAAVDIFTRPCAPASGQPSSVAIGRSAIRPPSAARNHGRLTYSYTRASALPAEQLWIVDYNLPRARLPRSPRQRLCDQANCTKRDGGLVIVWALSDIQMRSCRS